MSPTALEIKIKALERLIKEEKLYEQELAEQQQVIDKLSSKKSDTTGEKEEEDEYFLKKQKQVLEDTERVIVQVKQKVGDALSLLKEHLGGLGDDETENATVKGAKELITNTEAVIASWK